jgi:hypothetical protein
VERKSGLETKISAAFSTALVQIHFRQHRNMDKSCPELGCSLRGGHGDGEVGGGHPEAPLVGDVVGRLKDSKQLGW